MFAFTRCFNSDLSNWNTSNVVNMDGMFKFTESFISDLSKWDVSKIIGINEMFTMAKKMTEELKPKFNNLRYVSLN